MFADNGGAQDTALLVDDDLDEAFGPAFGLGAIVFVIGPAQDVDVAEALSCRFLGQPLTDSEGQSVY